MSFLEWLILLVMAWLLFTNPAWFVVALVILGILWWQGGK
jgi:hypothetical protein